MHSSFEHVLCVQNQAPPASQLREQMPSPLIPQTSACASSTASVASEGLQDGFHTHPGVGQAAATMSTLADPFRSKIRSVATCHGPDSRTAGDLLVSAVKGVLKVQRGIQASPL